MTDMTEAEKRIALEEMWDEPEYGEYAWLLPGIKSDNAEHVVELCRRIQQSHSVECIDGVLVDAWTAAAIVKVADGLNPTNRAKFFSLRTVEAMGKKAQKVCFRAAGRASAASGS